ncbi:hypothetical protein [Shewanella colwelliana]|uniref:hypothetical protein n=1 Tax=Shewanella colwelliana TaxID=23 RepID=UPI0022AF19F4|nr:hypothetical protein [Shewanella colwelliana]MCZ4337647.1 hypothetical protein [Shewanella colwelliana]
MKLFNTLLNLLVSAVLLIKFTLVISANYDQGRIDFFYQLLFFVPVVVLALTVTRKRLTESNKYGLLLFILFGLVAFINGENVIHSTPLIIGVVLGASHSVATALMHEYRQMSDMVRKPA